MITRAFLQSLIPAEKRRSPTLADKTFDFIKLWAAAIKKAHPLEVVPLYAEDATLLGTVASTSAADKKEIYAYFKTFFDQRKDPEVILEFPPDKVQCKGLLVIAEGEYDFVFKQNGVRMHLPARYSFVLERHPSTLEFKIIHHHSSALPGFCASPLDNQPAPEIK